LSLDVQTMGTFAPVSVFLQTLAKPIVRCQKIIQI